MPSFPQRLSDSTTIAYGLAPQAEIPAEDPELQELAQELLEALKETSQGKEALSKYNIQIEGGQVGVIGDNAHIEGGIKFGK